MSTVSHKTACPACKAKGGDWDDDNLVHYVEGGAYCFACGHTIRSQGYGELIEEKEWVHVGAEFNEEIHQKLKENTTVDPRGFRGLSKEVCSWFGVRHSVDTATGEVDKQYYPTTTDGLLTGYKWRSVPKNFGAIGETGKACDLFGQFRFKSSSGKYCLIVGGELDQLSAFTMLKNYQDSRGNSDYEPIPVVSSTIGESGAAKQIQQNYAFFDKFERCIICMDSDEAGRAAAEKVAKVLPKSKIYMMEMSLKDPNEYLVAGKGKEFVSAFYNAKRHTPAGIVGSENLYDLMLERAKVEKVSFPPFLAKLNDMLAGGAPLGYIINLAAGSSTGKTTFLNEIVLHLIQHSPYPIGIVSLEASGGEYSENLLSRYMGRKLAGIKDTAEKVATYESEQVRNAAQELFTDGFGNAKFHLLDDNGDYTRIQEKVEEMVISLGVKVLLIDPASDLFSGMTTSEVEIHMTWQKKVVKQYNILIVNVMHLRKTATAQKSYSNGGMPDEESISGSSTQYKSAGINILLSRDKMAEDEVTRNTTQVWVSKNRAIGQTGLACEVIYDMDSHTLMDKEVWLQQNPQEF